MVVVAAGRFAEAVVEACGAVWGVSSSCSKAGVEEDVWVASKLILTFKLRLDLVAWIRQLGGPLWDAL